MKKEMWWRIASFPAAFGMLCIAIPFAAVLSPIAIVVQWCGKHCTTPQWCTQWCKSWDQAIEWWGDLIFKPFLTDKEKRGKEPQDE